MPTYNELHSYFAGQRSRAGARMTSPSQNAQQPSMASPVEDVQERLRRMDFSFSAEALQQPAASVEPR